MLADQRAAVRATVGPFLCPRSIAFVGASDKPPASALLLPIVALKAGRTGAGRRAASSHTATMEAGELAVEALFHQAVVIRAGTLEEMFDIVAVVSPQPAPAGTAGRGADQRRRPGHPGRRGLRSVRAAGAGTVGRHPGGAALRLAGPGGYRDPVDVVASASAEQYVLSLRLLGAAEEIDAITVVFIVPFLPCAEDVTREIIAAVADLPAKPVIAVFMMAGAGSASLSDVGVPRLHLPRAGRRRAGTDRAVGGVAGPARGPRGDTPGIDPRRGRELTRRGLASQPGGGWADAETAGELLAAYGIAAARSRLVRTPAAAAQPELGGPVAVKIAAAIHKSDVGGVALGIDSPQAAADAVTAMASALGLCLGRPARRTPGHTPTGTR